MRMRTIGICTLATVLAAGGAMGVSAAPGAGRDGGGERPLGMLLSGQFGRLLALRSEMNLTTEQRDQIHNIVKGHREEIVTVMKPVVEKRRALRAATIADHPDEKAIRSAANELGKAIGDAAVVGSKIKAEVFQVLTPEQREKVAGFRKQADAAVDQFIEEAAAQS